MSSFNDISKEYADRLLDAIYEDGFTKTASLNEVSVRYSRTTAVLKKISDELDTKWTVDGNPLDEEQKKKITEGIAEHLGLSDVPVLRKAVKAASNDSYMELVTNISQILKGKKK